jgi:ribosomal protein S18 acetylase RimI-like enzyme
MDPRVRCFSPHDEPAVLEIVRAGVADQQRLATALGLPPDTSAVDRGGLRSVAAMHDRPKDCYIAEVDGAVVGFMRVGIRSAAITREDGGQTPDTYLVVEEIDVDRTVRGRGVGTALLALAERIAPMRGCALVGLLYLANNQASAGIARKRDFTLKREELLRGPPRSEKVIARFKRIS